MARLHVMVDRQGMVVATGPAPEDTIRKGEDGPMYAGFSAGEGADAFRTYEIEVEDRVNLSRTEPDVDRFHARLGDLIRTTKNLKPVEFRR